MRSRASLPAASLALLLTAATAHPRELLDIALPKAPNGVADVLFQPNDGRLVVNVNKKGEFFVDRTDAAFGKQFVIDNWNLKPGLVKVDAKALRTHLNQGKRFFVELKQAARPEWPTAPHVLLRIHRDAAWRRLDPLFEILRKEGITDVRYHVELGKKSGVLRTTLMSGRPKGRNIKLKFSDKTDIAKLAQTVREIGATRAGKHTVTLVVHLETSVRNVVTILDALFAAKMTEINFQPPKKPD